jgi:hypothetical protein
MDNTLGMMAALQTILERYPVLIKKEPEAGKTSFTFMLNILKMFGVTDEAIVEWMSNLLSDKSGQAKGLLFTIEQAIKVILLSSIKETYTCAVDPIIPDDMMYSVYPMESGNPVRGNGVKIRIEDIDMFGVLSNCPTDEFGSLYYFDNTDKYNPTNIYSSTDFNAFLWFVINKGINWIEDPTEKRKCLWDNRVLYRSIFEKNGCLDGASAVDDNTLKGKFFATDCSNSPMRIVPDLGPKTEILYCSFYEGAENSGTDYLRVFANADRYYKTSLAGGRNKTMFEFNTDYITSLKLFDSKTVVTQIINAVLGLTASASVNFTIERNIIAKKVSEIVGAILEESETETEIDDCFYSFSNEEYDRLTEEALLNYKGKFLSNNETNEEISIDQQAIYDELYKMESVDNLNEQSTIIKNIFFNVANTLSSTEETEAKNRFTFSLDIIRKFIEEMSVQIILQVLSPKVMLFFAINDKVFNRERDLSIPSVADFFRNFKNLIVQIIRKITNLILQALYDFLMGQIKPLITIFIQKLLLESIMYYKLLIEQLIKYCTPDWRFNEDALLIDDVSHADIVKPKNEPFTKETCRK